MRIDPEEYPVHVKVSGDWACFTRPELKVERVSYPVMTPSAARGILEAIFWKRQLFRWNVRCIAVLKPIQFSGIRRNEVKKRLSRQVRSMRIAPLQADDPDCRDQRNTVALRDVAYIITATIHLMGQQRHPIGHANPYHEYQARFRDRVRRGGCYARPVLGCREFAADFGPAEPEESERGIDRTEPLGLMFYDFFDIADHAEEQQAKPRFFPAALDTGRLAIDRSTVMPRLMELREP